MHPWITAARSGMRTLPLALPLLLGTTLGPSPATALPTPSPSTPGQQVAPGQVPQGLSASQWSGIQAQMQSHQYRVSAAPQPLGGYQAANTELGLTAHFGTDGATRIQVSGNAAAQHTDQVSLQLSGVGYAQLQPVGTTPQLHAQGGQLHYRWSQNLTEWWVNEPGKLEQWFRLEQRPPGAHPQQPLRLAMALQTALHPVLVGQQLQLHDAQGTPRMHYDRLKVWDARGTELPAQMHLHGKTLTLAVDDAQARYPLTIDPSWAQQVYIKASNTGQMDAFGFSVALSGNTMAVGAPDEDSNATGVGGNQANNLAENSGAVYVFTRNGNTWIQQAYLKASNTGSHDEFGISVALSGDTLAVGAHRESSDATGVGGDQASDAAVEAGVVYVFTRNAGVWSQQAYIKASNTDAGDRFGASVALEGDTLAVGAHRESSNATGVNNDQLNNLANGSGAVYVFTRNAGAWSQQAYLKASNTEALDGFGAAVALSGDTLAVTAPGEDSNATGVNGDQHNNLEPFSGAAYVFTRNAGTWSQQAYIKASNAWTQDEFGAALALSGDTLAVGAVGEDSSATGVNGDQSNQGGYASSGAVYVFTRNAGTWSQQAYIKASNTGFADLFGGSLALSGNTLAVGAGSEASNATGVNGNQANNSLAASGAVYVFTRQADTWSQQAYIKASNPGNSDFFGNGGSSGTSYGTSIALADGTLVVGARGEGSAATGIGGNQANDNAPQSGAVYVFQIQPHQVTPSAGAGGSIAPAVAQSVPHNQTTAFTLTPQAGFAVAAVNGTCGGTLAGNVFTTAAVTDDCTVEASFVPTHTITTAPTPAAGGVLACIPTPVTQGSTANCTATPAAGYSLVNISGCGGVAGAASPYTTGAITAACTVTANFVLNGNKAFNGQTVPPGGAAGGPAAATFIGGGAGCGFDAPNTAFIAAPAAPLPGQTLPQGMFKFRLTGCDASVVTMTITWPAAVASYTKYGKASGIGDAPSYFAPDNLVINNHTVSFTLRDGHKGDDDWTENGVIVDPSGPVAFAAGAGAGGPGGATAIPTLNEWGLLLLSLLAATLGARRLRKA